MSDPTPNWSFETRQIHVGQEPDAATGARALPIYQTTSYVFKDTDHAANLFALKEFGNIYTRIMNPTQDAVEQRIASLEGGVGALLVASGQAAETIAILNIAEAGDHVVASPSLYGGTFNLLKHTLPKFGIEVTFVADPNDIESWKSAVRPNTKLFFGETIANPKSEVLDIEAVAQAAHDAGVPLVVDNTIATPYLIRPLEWGADVVVHSATKYLGGHGTSIAGVIVDGGTFDYGGDQEKFPNYNTPEESYHGLVFARDLGVGSRWGSLAFILKARCSSCATWARRSRRSTPSGRAGRRDAVASTDTSRHPQGRRVPAVQGPGRARRVSLAARARKLREGAEVHAEGRGRGAGLRDPGPPGGQALRRGAAPAQPRGQHRRRSLAIHPASTTHSRAPTRTVSPRGSPRGLVRLAVGIEHIDDIIADLEQGSRQPSPPDGGRRACRGGWSVTHVADQPRRLRGQGLVSPPTADPAGGVHVELDCVAGLERVGIGPPTIHIAAQRDQAELDDASVGDQQDGLAAEPVSDLLDDALQPCHDLMARLAEHGAVEVALEQDA